MKVAGLVLPCLLIFSLQLSTQVTSGSVVAVRITDDAIAVAADSSRKTTGTIQASDKPLRPPCKLTALTPKLFFARSGRTGVSSWTTTDEARAAYKEMVETEGEDFTVSDLAGKWGERTKRIYGQAWLVHGEDLVKGLKDNKVTIGLFGAERSGSLFLYEVVVRFERNQSDIPTFSYTVEPVAVRPTPSFRARSENGVVQGVQEFYANTTPRSRREDKRFWQGLGGASQEDLEVLKLIAAVEAAIKWVGDTSRAAGPIDALVLKKGKPLRWVSKKCECPAN